jgi:hypothetical protein
MEGEAGTSNSQGLVARDTGKLGAADSIQLCCGALGYLYCLLSRFGDKEVNWGG